MFWFKQWVDWLYHLEIALYVDMVRIDFLTLHLCWVSIAPSNSITHTRKKASKHKLYNSTSPPSDKNPNTWWSLAKRERLSSSYSSWQLLSIIKIQKQQPAPSSLLLKELARFVLQLVILRATALTQPTYISTEFFSPCSWLPKHIISPRPQYYILHHIILQNLPSLFLKLFSFNIYLFHVPTIWYSLFSSASTCQSVNV